MLLPNIASAKWSGPISWSMEHDYRPVEGYRPGILPLKNCFVGPVIVQFLIEEKRDDRIVRVYKKFSYFDPEGTEWPVEEGAIVNGASIPRILWSFPLAGSPFVGDYRRASVVHDYYCDLRNRPYQKVARVFYDAMITDDCWHPKAFIFYEAVKIWGPKWDLIPS